MTTNIFNRMRDDRGFTLIELLVVILIIGILAAIALPAFLRQADKGRDADAKSNARNMVSQVEACWLDAQTFVGCDTTIVAPNTNLPIGNGPGQVALSNLDVQKYTVTSISEAVSGGANHVFVIQRDSPGVVARTCTVPGAGGCPADGNW